MKRNPYDENRTFAERHRLKVSRDECNVQVIQGRREPLYFDGAEPCLILMVLEGKPAIRSQWKVLGGRLWMGDISKNTQGVRVQDVKITGIPFENAGPAIRMCRIKPRRIMTDAQQAALERARSFPPPPCAEAIS